MQNSNLNLARKWRSKNFDQIIGQDLVVRILKNSLYLNQFFPVYLFSGQRGCGKTSTARIFATALNCEKLAEFQKNPKTEFPCFQCASCIAMQNSKHPDFIEMDAASHTGVDNVRNIIEFSTLMPVLGKKKIYLIDEAHMLSKAAFNAFIKILEEPPISVIFILATTDVEKIIDTVRSSCFQLIFSALPNDSLVDHLSKICEKENIEFERDGLELIVNESEGSARDAINLMEQVRFSAEKITKSNVQKNLGHPDDEKILMLFAKLSQKVEISNLLGYLSEISFYELSATFIWGQILKLSRVAIYLKYGVIFRTNFDLEKISEIIKIVNVKHLINVMEIFCNYEQVFAKTSNKNILLETLFFKILDHSNKIEVKTSSLIKEPEKKSSETVPWATFLQKVEALNDPLVFSVFKRAKFINAESDKVIISFFKNYEFLLSILNDTRTVWSLILEEIFKTKNLETQIVEKEKVIEQPKADIEVEIHKAEPVLEPLKKNFKSFQNSKVDVSDKDKWKLANYLLESFPGDLI